MRINQYLAQATGVSRRQADTIVAGGRVKVNGQPIGLGYQVVDGDTVTLSGNPIHLQTQQTILFHKPVGYVTSRRKQGSTPTIYRLLPPHFHRLKPVGRLDKDSSGLILLTSDGELAQKLTHPSHQKSKRYYITTKQPLSSSQLTKLNKGVKLEDGISKLVIQPQEKGYEVILQEGRNRQIRRSIEAVDGRIATLHRDQLGSLTLKSVPPGQWRVLTAQELGRV